MESIILDIKSLSKSYGKLKALNEVTFSLSEGEYAALLGPNGAGKTTLFQILTGLFVSDNGEVFVNNSNMRNNAIKALAHIGVVFQQITLDLDLTVIENLKFHSNLHGITEKEFKNRVTEELEQVNLSDRINDKVRALSGGQKRRVELARSLLHKPKLLLLDEPLAALDKQLRVQTQFELVNLQYKLGITFIIVTHDQEEAMSLSDRMAIMKNGEILQVGNPVEIYEKPKDKYIANFIGTANIFNVLNKNNQIIIKELNYEVKNINNKENYVKCLIRPEKISVKKLENQSDNLNIGVVKEVAYLGSYTKYLIDVNGFEFYSFMQNSLVSDNLQIRWDDKVQISFNETSIYFFND